MIALAATIYVAAMLIANTAVFAFGPSVTPIVAFVLIGLDLSLRDWLHIKIRPQKMALLIALAGVLTYALNPSAGMIAVASSASFTAAALVDWAVFSGVTGSWLRRSAWSNLAGAAVDSALFPTLAFGALMPHIVVAQFAAKVLGGAAWTYLIYRLVKRKGAQA